MPLEGLCSETEAKWFYWGWSRVYDVMQPFFTSDTMRDAGLDMAHIASEAPAVLDVGAGTGTLSCNLLRRVARAQITLLDQSPEMLERAKLKPQLQQCKFELADAQALPFEDSSFDHVMSSGSLYYYPRPVTALQEQLRVVKPGGTVLAMGSLQPKPRLIRWLATTFNRFPTEEEYASWFRDAGLTDIRTKHVSNPWNAQQYALAICGTKAAGTPPPPRASLPRAHASSWRKLLQLPVTVLRFGVAMAAFCVIGPIQILNAAMGMRRLRQQS